MNLGIETMKEKSRLQMHSERVRNLGNVIAETRSSTLSSRGCQRSQWPFVGDNLSSSQIKGQLKTRPLPFTCCCLPASPYHSFTREQRMRSVLFTRNRSPYSQFVVIRFPLHPLQLLLARVKWSSVVCTWDDCERH
ncbi:Uncharacterized protein TCM_012751 [Theobroma cacao]|uniref:Uncharacterized protein n=1 Tax=Theobroma cacao TaxID=3641 RepID=A0A061FVP3_THECC|nr:Uncharacterized protein TCM_012751 [Theobroma cacao]